MDSRYSMERSVTGHTGVLMKKTTIKATAAVLVGTMSMYVFADEQQSPGLPSQLHEHIESSFSTSALSSGSVMQIGSTAAWAR
jgi:hypothetical protein